MYLLKCIYCLQEMVASNLNHNTNEDLVKERYFCFECNILYECTSQSGDMIEENLDELGQI